MSEKLHKALSRFSVYEIIAYFISAARLLSISNTENSADLVQGIALPNVLLHVL